ncbi:hypothetical protein Q5530_11430 [Saccharothrix sp. BKS2]|uniref:hypothetical protein n=1 Tax=Saccharothrix sp. BKS2 TaxID=3064400 RepID=UPI0039E7451B
MGVPRWGRHGVRAVHNAFDGHAGTVLQIGVVAGDVVAPRAGPGLDGTADGLAAVVRRQWEAEASVRSLRRPEPLRLRWAPPAAGSPARPRPSSRAVTSTT